MMIADFSIRSRRAVQSVDCYFGSRFWHGRVLLGTAWGLTACALLWFRYRGPSYWNRLQRHGTRREIQRFKAALVVFALMVVAVSVVLAVEGLLK